MTEQNRDKPDQVADTDRLSKVQNPNGDTAPPPKPGQDDKPVDGDTIAELGDTVGGPA